MPIMLATYSTNEIIVLKRYVDERRKKHQPNKHTYINKQSNKEILEEENTGLIN